LSTPASPFGLVVITIYICGLNRRQVWSYHLDLSKLEGWPPDFAGPPPYLVGLFLFFENFVTGPHWAFAHCHVASNHWPMSFTCAVTLPHRLSAMSAYHVWYRCHMSATSRTTCHVVVQTTMWHFLISPHADRKMSKMGDTWQPLVLPHHHADVNMTSVILFMCHVQCTNVDVIRTDANVSSTDADSSLMTGLG
jgi:hypothetical protein